MVIAGFLLLRGRSTALWLALWLCMALVNTAWHDKPPNPSV